MSNVQLTLGFPWIATCKPEPVGQTPTKKCRKCSQEKALEEFPLFSGQECGRKNTCKRCSNELASVRRRLRKHHPIPPPGSCPACGRDTHKWVLDHCHHTDEFRGYICDSCNLGFGKFDDDPNMIQRALNYLLTCTNAHHTDRRR